MLCECSVPELLNLETWLNKTRVINELVVVPRLIYNRLRDFELDPTKAPEKLFRLCVACGVDRETVVPGPAIASIFLTFIEKGQYRHMSLVASLVSPVLVRSILERERITFALVRRRCLLPEDDAMGSEIDKYYNL